MEVLKNAISLYGKLEMVNSDQGSQFTIELWISYLDSEKTKINMDGKGRGTDNIISEKLWRTVKCDYIYLKPADNGIELFSELKEYSDYFNQRKTHHCNTGILL